MINLFFHPAIILILTAILLLVIPKKLKGPVSIIGTALAFFVITKLSTGILVSIPFLDYSLDVFRADKLSKAFGYIFTLSACAGMIYGTYQQKALERSVILFYVAGALGVVFAGDIFTLYIWWESMALSASWIILFGKTKRSLGSAYRYILVHVVGGLILLAGIIITYQGTTDLTFNAFLSSDSHLGTWLILIGFLINAAAVPFSSWLPDAYPEASVLGGVILSAYTSKTAVYTLIRGFAGWDILIGIGCAMTIYGIIYALLENDMRRILGYSIINQVGFMVCAVGIGSPLALSGAVAHAFCHIIYKALLWMSAGAVLYRTGKSKCTDLGGLYNTMPLTLILGGIGALAISAVPFTSGFTSKTIIIAAAEHAHLFFPWLILEVASAGVVLHAAIKFPYFVFFAKDKGLRPKEAPKAMLVAMGILAFLCVYLGCFPEKLYNILPNSELVKQMMPVSFSDIYVHHFSHVVTQFQLLMFSTIVFFLFLPLLKRTDTISLDFDWFYRKASGLIYCIVDKSLNTINSTINAKIAEGATEKGAVWLKKGPSNIIYSILKPLLELFQVMPQTHNHIREKIEKGYQKNSLPIGGTALIILIALALLVYSF